MIYLLDTNILIDLIKNHPPQVADRIDALDPDDSLAMSFITWAQLLQGAEGSQRREATLRQLNHLARQVPMLIPEDEQFCGLYAVAPRSQPMTCGSPAMPWPWTPRW